MESSVSNLPESDDIAELGAEAGWEDFAACCNLSSTGIFAIELKVRTATEGTNMMFITGILRLGQDVLEITMACNQKWCAASTGSQKHNDAVQERKLDLCARHETREDDSKSMESRVFVDHRIRVSKRLRCRLPILV